jgi:hypothetical protein
MSDILKKFYGSAEGPLGFPMTDRQAFALESVLNALPKTEEIQYRRLAINSAMTEIAPSERDDVSWINTEDPDRCREIVIAKGMNDSQFALNPIVTLNHA